MPYVCCVPACRGNYKTGPKVHCFQFPNNKNLRKKWLDAIPRKDFIPTKHSKVCELHFPKDKLIFSSSVRDSRTDQVVTVKLAFPKLSVGAVPSLFPHFPKYIENITSHLTDVKSKAVGQGKVWEAIENSEKDEELHKQTVCYDNFDDFLVVLKSFPLPRHWNKIITNEKVTFFKLIESPGPLITYSVVINTTLKVNTFLYGQEINISIMKVAETELKTPFLSNNIREIEDLLSEIDKCDNQDKSNSKDNNSHHILNHVSNIIDSVICETSQYENSERNNILSFIREQLKLVTSCNERYRYSSNTQIVSSILHVVSCQAYNFLRHAELYVLPHPKTIASICGPVITDRIVDDQDISLQHASDIFQYLEERDKHVILTFNEIPINPSTGSLTGSASSVKSVFAFTLTSVNSSFKEVVYIVPIIRNYRDMMFSLIKAVIVNLEGIGYKVFCVVSDNNAVNSKVMSHFAIPNQLSIVYPHPVSKSRPLFYLFDTLQLLKCIHSDWLSCKLDQSFHYPHMETGVEKVADLYALKELYRLQYDALLKSGYSLSWKALCPTKLERRNVELILQVFNPLIVQALEEFGGSIDKSKETAEFINIILTWWKIVNVKTVKRKPANDEYQQPVTVGSDLQIIFLEKMLNWLNTWKESKFSKKFATQTHIALTHTIYGLLEVTKYCLNELNMDYVLLGKFQGDDLEYRFGKCAS